MTKGKIILWAALLLMIVLPLSACTPKQNDGFIEGPPMRAHFHTWEEIDAVMAAIDNPDALAPLLDAAGAYTFSVEDFPLDDFDQAYLDKFVTVMKNVKVPIPQKRETVTLMESYYTFDPLENAAFFSLNYRINGIVYRLNIFEMPENPTYKGNEEFQEHHIEENDDLAHIEVVIDDIDFYLFQYEKTNQYYAGEYLIDNYIIGVSVSSNEQEIKPEQIRFDMFVLAPFVKVSEK